MMRFTPVPSRFLVTAGLLLVTAGAALLLVEATVTDRAALVARADRILAAPPVRDALATRLANTLAPPAADPVATAARTPNPAAPLAHRAVASPAFRLAFAGVLGRIHGRVVDGADAPLTLDPALVGAAVSGARGGAATPIVMTLDPDLFPDAHHSLDRLRVAAELLLALGILVLGVGTFTSPHRVRVVMRIGRWAIAAGLAGVAWCWLLPTLLAAQSGWTAVAGLVLGTQAAVAVPALVVALIGAALLAGGHAWEQRDRRRTLRVIPHRPGRDAEWAGRA
jgi:hypothetical protein